ncbi:uncharacterized protein A1O9_12773 [Exophiala aquamarina CBS 119918]|uniref:JmjC domain-containing protein n=1 Tax=Exophiala aquamarina CBS 119918 TaxID=1182545 RepID=A0A072NTF0_9EURO|nr:uncharacterized protein A1O9_12773 [Exophiala aquamarina CBS 119918]KEF51159.1 hypothetical protein A1O9_12773 [Exophiala aquamarina CBS 119918]
MPSTRPCAAFEPISPDFDVKTLVESTPNFEWVVRIHCDMIDHQGLENFEKLVLIHVILGGKPLVIEGYETRLDRWSFATQWLRDNCGSKVETARDLTKKSNVPLSIGHYLNNMALLTNQWTNGNYKDADRQRMYLKDIDCPQLWRDKLSELLPPSLFYLNESTGDVGGFGAVDEVDPNRPGMRKGRGIAKSGDLMSSLPPEMRAENLMCYIGHEGTYTPAHREMCASLGQNIMVEASTGLVEEGKPTKPGSSIWFMTESKEREVVSEYWLSRLGHDIEVESHFAQINAWKMAPFKTYVVEQRPGDFILIPPLAPHQVWNRGTRTMKVAWNRTTVETLEMALHEALPRARMVCRDEQYKNKAIIYYTMQKYSKQLKAAEKIKQKLLAAGRHLPGNDVRVRQLEKDFRRLHGLLTEILVSESFSTAQKEPPVEKLTYDSNVTCSYCRCNIFNKFLTCPNCVEKTPGGDDDTYDICLECYAMGRSCACISKLKWVEQWPWDDLVQKHEQWRHQILQYGGKVTEKSPMSLKTELDRLGRKPTLAHICQLELQRRPFRDIRRAPSPVIQHEEEDEPQVDDEGRVKKRKQKKKTEKFIREHGRCHIDSYWEPKWKQASCSHCSKNYCYGSLFRAYDMKPQDILADPDWKCPSCRNICGCRVCCRKPGYKPYTPSSTMLGHNTKAVADPRSMEVLVDFSFSNIGWIQKAGDDNGANTRRLKKRRKEADAAKAQETQLGDDYVDLESRDNDIEDGILRLAAYEGIPIDPALGTCGGVSGGGSTADSDEYDENPEGARLDEDASPADLSGIEHAVPAGGVLRDVDHAYDMTEAITYDYPDPESGRHIAVTLEEEAAPIPPGYIPAVPDENGDIHMENRKRKRTKLDEGDRAFQSNKSYVDKGNKKRKSLIVKLPIHPEKLAAIKPMALMARQALNGTEVPAPVISSDLQALNAAEGNLQQVPKYARRGLEHVAVEQDDDFTPGRYRDRRKAMADGVARPPPDSDITRRQTRMHNVHYEEPDEEEFNEVLPNNPGGARKRNIMVVRLDDAELGFETDVEAEDENMSDVDATEVSSSREVSASTNGTPLAPNPLQDDRASSTRKSSLEPVGRLASISSLRPAGTARRTARQSPGPKHGSKMLAEAQANRKAKMAAIEWLDNDSEDLEDAWSENSFVEEPAPPKQQPNAPTPTAARPMAALETGITATVRRVPQMAYAEVASAPSKPVKPVASLTKVSKDAWVDSEGSDDEAVVAKPAGWASVNASNASSFQPATSKKRGRPRKS